MDKVFRNLSDSSFAQDVLQAQGLVLVAFTAGWSAGAVAMYPTLERLANEHPAALKVCLLDIDENESTPYQYGMRGLPTLMLFRDGEVLATKIGQLASARLEQWVRSLL